MVKPDMHTLAQHLKQERLYVASEKQLIQRLNSDVLKTAEKLHRAAWVAKQQRINLDSLPPTSAEASPAECWQRARSLDDAVFLEGYKALGGQESMYGEFLSRLRESPRLLASCLASGRRLPPGNSAQALPLSVFSSLYGNCVMPEDQHYLLQVLRYLIDLELKPSEDPRRLLCRSPTAFRSIFRLYSEGLHSARLFLMAALHEPIMQLLESDEDPLETDSARLLERHNPAEQSRLFGQEGSDRRRRKVLEATRVNKAKLDSLVELFAESLRQSAYCFPPGLRWVLGRLYRTMAEGEEPGGRVEPGDARAMCTHLLFTRFICPALMHPEKHGIISDAPVNEAAHFNLTQVAQLLQQLAKSDAREAHSLPRNRPDKSCVAAFFDAVIGGRVPESPPISSDTQLEGLSRTAVYITQNQLLTLVEFLQMVGPELPEDHRQALEALLTSLPQPCAERRSSSLELAPANAAQSRSGKSNSLELPSANTLQPQLSPGTTPANKRNRLQIASRSRSRTNLTQEGELEASSQDSLLEAMPEEVLVISLGSPPQTLPGMMSENEILSLHKAREMVGADPADDSKLPTKPDKTLRFDNLESISEGPSNPSNSVSSLDMEAGSVSEPGAEQSEPEAEPAVGDGVEALQLLEQEQVTTQDNLDHKLRKFEIRDVLGLDEHDFCETMSETWSTDVLGSDGEPSGDEERLQEITEAADLKHAERLQELDSCSGVVSICDDTEAREVSSRPSTPGVSMTSEDNPSKTEDLRSESSSDCGGRDCNTGAEGEELGPGISTATVVRPKAPPSRPPHPPPGPPIPEVYDENQEPRLSVFLEAEPGGGPKQRYSCPDRLERSRSSDVPPPARRPTSDPGLLRSGAADDREQASGFRVGSTSSSNRDSLRGEPEERKDSDDEKSDRGRPWWKKRFGPAISKVPFRKKDKQEREEAEPERAQQVCPEEATVAKQSTSPEAAEDILDKYRNFKRSDPSNRTSGATRNTADEGPDACSEGESGLQECLRKDSPQSLSTEDLLDSACPTAPNHDHKYTFSDAKKKLRLALCSADSVALPLLPHPAARNGLDHSEPEENEVLYFLKVQLAEAITLQDKSSIAQIQETMRCISPLDTRTCRRLLTAIANDYKKRAPYIAYLTRCRQGLQNTQAHLERMLQRVLRDKDVANRYFTTVCVKLFLESMEAKMQGFVGAFQGYTAADEKTAAVEDFVRYLNSAMSQDATLQYASEEQLQDAQVAIERCVMNRIFKLAFYPNQDGDILRDQLLQEHIQRLSKVVSANHKALQIPEVYLKEAPWPSAQSEIRAASAYKTPRDKVQCVLRMCSAIMNLLSLANEDSVPGADDFVPVLVFVLIKANPPCLLSTVQYINNFYASRLSGEDSYWWMQFTAAVEFIKTIDDRK
ncbi:hypothetical protein GJAV_G00038870 [Gymnothorax javanicus]|nr:hypothetical protein GJAV_G00038870 [Gymnothorax javanicus]